MFYSDSWVKDLDTALILLGQHSSHFSTTLLYREHEVKTSMRRVDDGRFRAHEPRFGLIRAHRRRHSKLPLAEHLFTILFTGDGIHPSD
jgi:hypothetical protein